MYKKMILCAEPMRVIQLKTPQVYYHGRRIDDSYVAKGKTERPDDHYPEVCVMSGRSIVEKPSTESFKLGVEYRIHGMDWPKPHTLSILVPMDLDSGLTRKGEMPWKNEEVMIFINFFISIAGNVVIIAESRFREYGCVPFKDCSTILISSTKKFAEVAGIKIVESFNDAVMAAKAILPPKCKNEIVVVGDKDLIRDSIISSQYQVYGLKTRFYAILAKKRYGCDTFLDQAISCLLERYLV